MIARVILIAFDFDIVKKKKIESYQNQAGYHISKVFFSLGNPMKNPTQPNTFRGVISHLAMTERSSRLF
jgi:hypothetical protein